MKRLALLLLLPLALAVAPARADDPATNAPAALPAIDDSVSSEELWRRATSPDPDSYRASQVAFNELQKRAFKGDDEAMSLYFWKTDDGWFDFFPVTIRSVEPETGEDANAATNWIVTLLGGIKVRTADPAAAFGAPLDALPGRRLGVRFGDNKDGWLLDGAPSAMSNACVYAGRFEVRPLLPASERDAAREIVYRNLDDLGRLSDAGKKELEERIGECWANMGSGLSIPVWYFEGGARFLFAEHDPLDGARYKAALADESPVVTIDGEIVATRKDVAEFAMWQHRSTERAAKDLAEEFLLEREAKKRGFGSAYYLIHDGLGTPSDDDLRPLWDRFRTEEPERLLVGDRATIGYIVVSCPRNASAEEESAARAKIDAARARLVAGESFADVARTTSDAPGVSGNGGRISVWGETSFAELKAAAFGQDPGAIGEPFRSGLGWHIVRVESVEPAHDRTFKETRQELDAKWTNARANERRAEILASLFEAATVIYAPATNAPAAPTPHAESAEGAKEPAP